MLTPPRLHHAHHTTTQNPITKNHLTLTTTTHILTPQPISSLHFNSEHLISSMYTLPLNKSSYKHPLRHTGRDHIKARIVCSVTTKPAVRVPPPPLQSSPPLPPPPPPVTGKRPVINDPTLRSTWTHRAWVASGCTSVLVALAKSVVNATDAHVFLEPILAGVVGYILADLGTGVYHWAIDNYGDATTPVFGSQIDAFQGHHRWPWTITRRQFANNLHALARVVTFIVVPIDLAASDPAFLGFAGMCSGCIMFSQQFHAWAHGTKSKLPPAVVALQESGVLVSRTQHADHHRQPYNNNYCIVSGVWNKFLDENTVFEALEMILFFKFGVRPRSWDEPSSEWTEEIQAH